MRIILDRTGKRVLIVICVILSIVFIVTTVFYAYKPFLEKEHLKNLALKKEGRFDGVEIICFDVGQSDCTLITLPDGKNVLIDGGTGDRKEFEEVASTLYARGVENIDYLVLTHILHTGWMSKAFEFFSVGKIFMPDCSLTRIDKNYTAFYNEVEKNYKDKVTVSARGVSFGEGEYHFEFLMPYSPDNPQGQYAQLHSPDITYNMLDDSSAVLYFEYKDFKGVFMSDLSKEQCELLLSDVVVDDDLPHFFGIDFLRVSDHGDDDGLCEDLLNVMSATICVISAGVSNEKGDPEAVVLKALSSANADAQILRTDLDGSVSIHIKGGNNYEINHSR